MGVKRKHLSYVPKDPIYYDNFSSDEESEVKQFPSNMPMLKTSAVACTFKDGVVMGTVSKTKPEKIFDMNNGTMCSGFGTAASNAYFAREIENERIRISENEAVRSAVDASNRLYKRMLRIYSRPLIQAAILIGGISIENLEEKPSIYKITSRHSREVPYAAAGIRSFASMDIFDANWKPNLEEIAAIQIVKEALDSVQFPRNSIVEMEVMRND